MDFSAPILDVNRRRNVDAHLGGRVANRAGAYKALPADALVRRSQLLREWSAFFEERACWLTATLTELPFEIAADIESVDRVDRVDHVGQILDGYRVLMATSTLGLPSAVVPLELVEGLPQSVQIIGPRFSELRCLEVVEVIETSIEPLTPIEPFPLLGRQEANTACPCDRRSTF